MKSIAPFLQFWLFYACIMLDTNQTGHLTQHCQYLSLKQFRKLSRPLICGKCTQCCETKHFDNDNLDVHQSSVHILYWEENSFGCNLMCNFSEISQLCFHKLLLTKNNIKCKIYNLSGFNVLTHSKKWNITHRKGIGLKSPRTTKFNIVLLRNEMHGERWAHVEFCT